MLLSLAYIGLYNIAYVSVNLPSQSSGEMSEKANGHLVKSEIVGQMIKTSFNPNSKHNPTTLILKPYKSFSSYYCHITIIVSGLSEMLKYEMIYRHKTRLVDYH